jgi:hypothetical protein
MPKERVPIRASPDSFKRMRLKAAALPSSAAPSLLSCLKASDTMKK